MFRSGYKYFYLFLPVLIAGCFKKEEIKKLEIPAFQQGWGLPLIDTKLQLKDLVAVIDKNIGLREESDRSYSFIYRDTIVSPFAEELLVLSDQSFQNNIPFPETIPGFTFPLGAPPVKGNYEGKEIFDPGNGGKFLYANLKGGNLQLNLNNGFLHQVSLDVTLQSVLDEFEKPVTVQVQLPPSSSKSVNVPLIGKRLTLSENAAEVNQFRYNINYSITSTGQPLSSGDELSFDLKLQNLRYSLIVGDIGRIDFPD